MTNSSKKKMEQILRELDFDLSQICNLQTIRNHPPYKNPGVCEWCRGQCGVMASDLTYCRYMLDDESYSDPPSPILSGWFSPACHWLVENCRDAVDRDQT